MEVFHLKGEGDWQDFENVYLFLLTPDSHILEQLVLSSKERMVAKMINELSRSELVDDIKLNSS